VRKKLVPALITAFLGITLIRSPEAAGDLVATIGTMLGVLVDEMINVVVDLFRK